MTMISKRALTIAAFMLTALPAYAQQVEPNRLDCRFSGDAAEMSCPSIEPVTEGRAATDQQAASSAERGTPEWNRACAAKFKSFNPATGMYTSFSGQERPCS